MMKYGVLPKIIEPGEVTLKAEHVAVPCAIGIALSGTPKDSIVPLNAERTTGDTGTLREGVKAAAIV